jgi:hypothetical protein
VSNDQEGAFGTQYEDTYPGMLQKLLVIESRHGTQRYYLGNPDDFEAQDITAFLQKYPGHAVKVEWMIVPLEGGEEVGPFDTTTWDYPLTPYPHQVRLGDFTTEGWKNVREYGVYPGPLPFTKEADSATTADLDARDHFASEVRALHPTQEDRIETALREVNARLGDDRIDLAQRISDLDSTLMGINERLDELAEVAQKVRRQTQRKVS